MPKRRSDFRIAIAPRCDNSNTRRMSGLFHMLTKKSADLRIDGIWAGGRSLGDHNGRKE
jgi:hypothetical protein